MKISFMRDNYRTSFNEAKEDIDWRRVSKLMDENDAIALMHYLKDHFDSMAEAVEAEIEAVQVKRLRGYI